MDDLLALSNLAASPWPGLPLQPDGGPPVAFSFLTSTEPDDVIAAKYKALRDDGLLTLGAVLVDAADGGVEQKPRYGVTEKFISEKLAGKRQELPRRHRQLHRHLGGGRLARRGRGALRVLERRVGPPGARPRVRAVLRPAHRLQRRAAPVSAPKERPSDAKAVEQWMQAQG